MLVFTLAVCRQPPSRDEGESTVLLNPSAPPCWYDICPGETTKDEAMSILLSIPEVEQDITDRYHENARSFVGWRFMDEVAEVGGRFYYRDQTISHFYFFTENKLTFGEAIEAFGEPTYVLPFSHCIGRGWLYIALIYPNDGLYLISFQSPWRRSVATELVPEQSVSSVILYNPAQFEELITHIEGANWASYSYDDILQIMQPWEGFGRIWVFDGCRSRP